MGSIPLKPPAAGAGPVAEVTDDKKALLPSEFCLNSEAGVALQLKVLAAWEDPLDWVHVINVAAASSTAHADSSSGGTAADATAAASDEDEFEEAVPPENAAGAGQ